MRLFVSALIVSAAAALSGCTTVAYTPGPAADTKVKTIAVLAFDASSAPDRVRDYAFLGVTRQEGIGAFVSDSFANALTEAGVRGVDRGETLINSFRNRGMTLDKFRALPPREVAQHLGVDAVIIGEVTRFGESWFFLFTRAVVAFNIECVEMQAGKTVWKARTRTVGYWQMDADLTARASRKLVELLKRKASFDLKPRPDDTVSYHEAAAGDEPKGAAKPKT